jgi:putative membrane protein
LKLLKIFPKNFINLILGRSVLNIADSFYMVAVTIALVEVYNIEASTLTSFALIGMIPSLVAFSYSYFFNKIKNTKFWILCFQIMHIILVSLLIIALVNKAHIAFIFIYNFLFNLVNCVLTSLNVKVTPEVLDNDNNLIKKSVDIQYFTSNSLDILSNFVASLLLGFITYLSLMQLSIPIFLAGVYFFTKLNLNKNIQTIEETEETEEVVEASIVGNIKTLFSRNAASKIIVIEAFLSGATDLLLKLLPLYLISINIDVKWLALVLSVWRGADLVGAMVAPFVKVPSKNFFYMDYLISGTSFLLVFIIDNSYLKLLFFFITFVVIGVSGNFFEKMIYDDYEGEDFGAIHTIITSFYSVFSVLFLLIPFVYDNIKVLGVSLNILTILFGLGIFVLLKFEKR